MAAIKAMHLVSKKCVIMAALGLLATVVLYKGKMHSLIATSKKIDTLHRRAQNKEHVGEMLRDYKARSLGAFDDIRVPRDMWRRPSEYPHWNPEPLPVCCYGKEVAKKCHLDEDDVRYYGPSMGYTPNDLKKVWRAYGGDLILMGDSTTFQWVGHLKCYLDGVDSTEDIPTLLSKGFRNALPEWRDKDIQQFSGFDVPSTEEGLPAQRVIYSRNYGKTKRKPSRHDANVASMEYFNNFYPRETSRPRPIFVINIGLHYNVWKNHNEGQMDHYRRDLRALFKQCYDLGAQCIIRETTPQWFDTELGNGLYPNFPWWCIKEPVKNFGVLDNWRNNVMRGVLREFSNKPAKEGGFLQLMPVFEKYEGFYGRHTLKDADCTHFSFDSANFEPLDLSLTQALLDAGSNGITQVY
mmetsp:Transcript_34022/g.41684  ORF Transcript_34022/g.41684 Transcript_34022/m.41684 type:complete len:409 (+) Transcript_34022:24-1250(+)